jgi:2-keto-4-pentenoate hydratase/2-oxohepta-3-ene-1,7-dioic acid hydratase in catechol pathway
MKNGCARDRSNNSGPHHQLVRRHGRIDDHASPHRRVRARRNTAAAARSKLPAMRIMRIVHRGAAHYARALTPSDSELELLDAAPWLGGKPLGEGVPLANVELLVPVAPSKIVCVGRNYAAHAAELGNTVPPEPLLFLKPPSALLAHQGEIVLPPQSERVEHEAEIGLVIGARLSCASPDEAARAVFGVTCVNDVTARDLQKKEVQFTRAKGFDTFCPAGPWIETDLTLEALSVTGRVNGTVRQHGAAATMVTPIPKLLSFISHAMTLEPGDLISTGTPEGVGPLVAGDTVEIEVSGVGVLRNTVGAR